jgi:hypothetical protein
MLYRGVERKYYAPERRPLRPPLQHDEPSIGAAERQRLRALGTLQ